MTTKFCGNFRSVTNWKIMIYRLSAQNRTIQVSQTAIKMGMFCDVEALVIWRNGTGTDCANWLWRSG